MGDDDLELPDDALASLIGRVGRMLGGDASGRGLRVGVACSRVNGGVTGRLLTGTLGFLEESGVDRSDVTVAWAPGPFELPLLARSDPTGPTRAVRRRNRRSRCAACCEPSE